MEKIWIKDGKFIELTEDQIKDLSTEQLAGYTTDKNQAGIDKMVSDFNTKMDDIKSKFLTKTEITNIKADFEKGLNALPVEQLAKYVETIADVNKGIEDVNTLVAEIKEDLRNQGSNIKAMGEKSIPDVRRAISRKQHVESLIRVALSSKEFEIFEGRGFTGSSNKMFLDQNADGKVELKDTHTKATVDTSSHTGNVMISEISDIVTDDAPTRRTHVRDILNVSMTDQAQIVAGQVYDFTDALTLGAVMLAENGEAPESVFKSKENTWGLKRIANSMRISKREIKVNGLKWVIDKVLAKLPDATLFVEDVQLLFGDGTGNNVYGLTKKAQAFDLTPQAYAAGAIASVATYDSGAQALITFTAAHGIKNGDSLIIASATETTYNATHASVEVINATQVVIDLAYVAEASTAAWTGTNTTPFYNEIEDAQEYDVLAVSDAMLEAGEFTCSAHIIHPSQETQLGLLKDSNGNYLNLSKDKNGRVIGVNGKPLVATTAMAYGKFLSGDFSRNGAELKEFTPLNIQFVEDVESVKKNEIVVVIEEEIIFPIYNPYWFTYGKFSTAKTQLLKL